MSLAREESTADRPLVTVGFLTYAQERYVREALRSVLAQTYSPLQIVVSDDASPDATFDILSEELRGYHGPHDILLNRNDTNLGIRHFDHLMQLAKGDFIVASHGDDLSNPRRVERLVATWRASGASVVASNGARIGEDGQDLGPLVLNDAPRTITLDDLAASGWNWWLFGGGLAWERRVFDVFGALNPDQSALGMDWIVPFRAALLGGIALVDEPLVRIRLHLGSKASRYLRSDDVLSHRESHMANRVIQFQYMFDTLTVAEQKGLIVGDRCTAVRGRLVISILQAAAEWRLYRNQLLAQGKRPQWLPV
jgi:glycosyltransferase involved in cell wall biosynthesis